jgi:hypothetical protein
MAIVTFSDDERAGLSQQDMALLHEFILNAIQTSPEIRGLIAQQPKPLVDGYPQIRDILRQKADPLRRRLKGQAKP